MFRRPPTCRRRIPLLWAVMPFFACAPFLATANESGLRLLWQKKIDSVALNAPYKGVISPSIWAVSFSPDGEYLALGVGIIKSSQPPYMDYKSYIALISTSKPDSAPRIFEVSPKPWSNGPRIVWSPNGKFLAIDHVSLLEKNAFVLDIESGREYTIPRNNCEVLGLLSGPRILMGGFFVQKIIRLVDIDGKAIWEWPISQNVAGAGYAVLPQQLALVVGNPSAGGVNTFHEFALLRAQDHSEILKLPFRESWGFSGAISATGSILCSQFYEPLSPGLRRIACLQLPAGNEIGGVPIELGQRASSPMVVAANARVAVGEGPGFPGYRSVWDVRSRRRLAHWSIPVQKLLPKLTWPAEYRLNFEAVYPYAISPDGTKVAEGGSGVIRMYALPN